MASRLRASASSWRNAMGHRGTPRRMGNSHAARLAKHVKTPLVFVCKVNILGEFEEFNNMHSAELVILGKFALIHWPSCQLNLPVLIWITKINGAHPSQLQGHKLGTTQKLVEEKQSWCDKIYVGFIMCLLDSSLVPKNIGSWVNYFLGVINQSFPLEIGKPRATLPRVPHSNSHASELRSKPLAT